MVFWIRFSATAACRCVHQLCIAGREGLVQPKLLDQKRQGLRTGGDDTAFIDQVALGAAAGVPEPGAWALMIVGFGMAGSLFRRRRALGV